MKNTTCTLHSVQLVPDYHSFEFDWLDELSWTDFSGYSDESFALLKDSINDIAAAHDSNESIFITYDLVSTPRNEGEEWKHEIFDVRVSFPYGKPVHAEPFSHHIYREFPEDIYNMLVLFSYTVTERIRERSKILDVGM